MSTEFRTTDIEFTYSFDADDIARIARACGVSPGERLTDQDISEYVTDLLTTELMTPDPLLENETEADDEG